MLIARFDGGCDPNPRGKTACACVIKRGEEIVFSRAVYLGDGEGFSNNVAEFEGLQLILKWYLDGGLTEPMTVIGDSQIVIWRMLGKYRKPAQGLCAVVAEQCLALRNWLPVGAVQFSWERRHNNDECDSLCAMAISEATK